jgi:hypothetical protein
MLIPAADLLDILSFDYPLENSTVATINVQEIASALLEAK